MKLCGCKLAPALCQHKSLSDEKRARLESGSGALEPHQCAAPYRTEPMFAINGTRYCWQCADVAATRDPSALRGVNAYCNCSEVGCAHPVMSDAARASLGLQSGQRHCANIHGRDPRSPWRFRGRGNVLVCQFCVDELPNGAFCNCAEPGCHKGTTMSTDARVRRGLPQSQCALVADVLIQKLRSSKIELRGRWRAGWQRV